MRKRISGLTLRARITLLAGAVILGVSLALTLVSMQNAGVQFNALSSQFSVEVIPPESESAAIKEDGVIGDDDGISGQGGEVMIDPRTEEARRAFNLWSFLSLFLFSGIGMGLAWVLAGRALAPLRDLEAAVSEISAGNLSSQLPERALPDEVGRLTAAFNRMLERLNQSFERQKRFSSSVAHELKTPLSTIKMSLQVARMEGEADEELLAVTERNVDRLIDVVGSLLELTHEMAAGPVEEIALCPLLRDIVQELTPLYAHRQLHVSYDFVEVPPTAGDPPLVRRLFGNLIENAMRYNRTGGEIHIGVTAASGVGCRVSVADTGPGIPQASLPLLFEPFYCVDQSRSRHLGGAGLGLSIARAIANQHGWILTAGNRDGGGAVFTVDMPEAEPGDHQALG